MNADPLLDSSMAEQMTVQERRCQSLSALLDGEIQWADLDDLLTHDADATALTVDCHAYEVIGEVLRGQPMGRRATGGAFAASVVSRLRDEPRPVPVPVVHQIGLARSPSANDAIFRWKMVAGLASLAAVVAVTWTVGVRGAGEPAAGPQLALTSPPALPADTVQPVIVQTAQGQVLRDARLEQLLSEHRQFGGMSALQAPAGFLRNATYDAAPQR